jgi:hypothetical protein
MRAIILAKSFQKNRIRPFSLGLVNFARVQHPPKWVIMAESGTVKTEGRAAVRRSTMAASTMRADGSAPIDVVVIDVSATGVRIATSVDLAVGQEISIGLAGAGSTRAFVAWKRGDQYGCQFERPLEPEGEARAFSQAQVVHLGPAPLPLDDAPRDDLRDLYLRHRPWRLPLDAILMFLLMVGLAVAGIWWLLERPGA